VFQSHLNSRVGRRLFIRFLLAAMLPMVGLSLFTYHHVSQLLLDNEYSRLKQDSKAYGMSLIEGLNSRTSQLKHHVSHTAPQTPVNPNEFSGFTNLTRLPVDAIPALSQADRHHLAQDRPLLRLSLTQPSLLLVQDKASNVIAGAIAAQALWKNDTAPENYCVIDTDHRPLFCTPELCPARSGCLAATAKRHERRCISLAGGRHGISRRLLASTADGGL